MLILVAVLIKLDSPGPIFFVQRRYGFNQQPFRIIKFRTMRALDDGPAIRQARRNDPRLTRVGRCLRRWNIDEVPQLFNVLTGDMSLVGPRPHALSHDREYEQRISRYARRHNVKPGITGWAQVHGYRGETDTDEKMRKRVEHDLYYIDNWSLWLDCKIIVRTVLSRSANQRLLRLARRRARPINRAQCDGSRRLPVAMKRAASRPAPRWRRPRRSLPAPSRARARR